MSDRMSPARQRRAKEGGERRDDTSTSSRSDRLNDAPRKASAEERLYCGNQEPQLRDVLSDPTVHWVMMRDGVGMRALVCLLDTVRRQLS